MDLTLETAKAYSVSVRAPLQWTISALFIEEIVKAISESELKDSYIIGGDYVISSLIGADFKVLPVLEFFIANDKKNNLLEIIRKSNPGILKITKVFESNIKQGILENYIVEGSLEGLRTSFSVEIKFYVEKPIWDIWRSREARGYTGLNRMDGVYCLCIEEYLVDKLNTIMISGEVINNMRSYYEIGKIITTVNLDGHKIIDCFNSLAVGPEQMLEELELLSKNKNLHKRWRAWCRDNHLQGMGYMDIFDCLKMIFNPLVKSYIANEVFFGEWVPELKRFIG